MPCKYKNRVWDNGWCNVACSYCTMTQEETCKHNHQTNADRIRAMNDEEMIELLKEFSAFSCIFPDKDCEEVSCVECVTKWLKQPVEDSR